MRVIANPAVFSQDYVPPRFVGREEYLSKLLNMIQLNDTSSAFVVRGNPGTGKTLLGKYLLRLLPEFRGFYVNCYVSSTDRAIVTQILNEVTGKSSDYLNTPSETLFRMLLRNLPKKTIVILDEAHSLKRVKTQVVYLLSRSSELGGPNVNLVLLSIEEPEMFLDVSTISGLGKYNRIALKEYSREELLEIIKDRSKSGFYEGSYTSEALDRIAYLVEDSGSARTAIELLRNSALLAESENSYLNQEMVLRAFRDFSPPLDDSSLVNLEDDEISLLYDLLNSIGQESIFRSSDIRSLKPDILDSRLYKFINSLELSGFIGKKKMGKGYGGGVENEYFFKIPPGVLLSKVKTLLRT
ncbi:MAG: Cdc6/Cdc18 family protein [Thermoplasmata archaeon]